MNPVGHFELPANDRVRSAKFYEAAFGWKTKDLGEKMNNYVTVQTDETDDKGMLKETNRINGGIYEKTADMPAQHPSVVIVVEDIKKHVGIVNDAGGKVLGEPTEIPGIGWYVAFEDTEGNNIRMLQPTRPM